MDPLLALQQLAYAIIATGVLVIYRNFCLSKVFQRLVPMPTTQSLFDCVISGS